MGTLGSLHRSTVTNLAGNPIHFRVPIIRLVSNIQDLDQSDDVAEPDSSEHFLRGARTYAMPSRQSDLIKYIDKLHRNPSIARFATLPREAR